MTKTKIKQGSAEMHESIHPTIGVCGKPNNEAFDLKTTPKLGASDSGKDNIVRASSSRIENKNKLFEKHAITGYGARRYNVGKYIGGIIKTPCPFCLRSQMIKHGKRYNKKSPSSGTQKYECLNCGKKHSVSNFFRLQTPDYVIDVLIDIITIENKFLSSRKIAKEIFKRVNYKIHHATICRLRNKYRKGKLFDYYYPNSKFNSIHKPKDMEYLPKKVIHESKLNGKTRKGFLYYNKDRLEKAINFLKKYDNQMVKSKLIREAYNIKGTSVHIERTKLMTHGYIKHLGNSFYYITLNDGGIDFTQNSNRVLVSVDTPIIIAKSNEFSEKENSLPTHPSDGRTFAKAKGT